MEKKKYTYPDIDITGTVDLSNPESVSSAIYAIYEAHYGNDHDNFNNIKKFSGLYMIYLMETLKAFCLAIHDIMTYLTQPERPLPLQGF